MRITLWLATVILLFALTVSGPLAATENDHFEALKQFSQVLDIVESSYVEGLSRSELIEDAIRGMLEQLDPHSAYLDAEEMQQMQENTSGQFSGIGIEISMEQGRLVVVSPIEDTPAYKAGLQAGDHIIEINGESTQDITIMDAVEKIRGEKGTSVTLTILHQGSNTPEVVDIVRGTIPITSVKTEVLDDGYLYVRLTKFNENTTAELHKALAKFRADQELKGLVLDLRNNPGGLLDQAVSVSDTFLSEGMIVYIQGKDEFNRHDFFAKKEASDVAAPMVVLTNAGSASASEIVAGCLQDHSRALLLGEGTFGKGSVQQIIPLSDGAGIKLTTALYYTPKGRSIQAQGIEPDLYVPFVPHTPDEEEKLLKSLTVHEKDLSGHLENKNGDGKSKSKADGTVAEMLASDNQLRLALEMVKKLPKIREIQ